nr:hypothetical protein BaRGS_010185 [Batillaria attramentaria]
MQRRKRTHTTFEDYQFNVFVSYASDDLDWVRAHLMPELEERMRLRLCVHDRDFRPGKEIMANITDSLEVSRKVMLIFSTEFARSTWCQFQLALRLRHVMDNADAMIVVYLHEIPPRELTNNMVAVMRTCTYLQWSNEPDARDLFWDRLRESLYDVIQDVRRRGP